MKTIFARPLFVLCLLDTARNAQGFSTTHSTLHVDEKEHLQKEQDHRRREKEMGSTMERNSSHGRKARMSAKGASKVVKSKVEGTSGKMRMMMKGESSAAARGNGNIFKKSESHDVGGVDTGLTAAGHGSASGHSMKKKTKEKKKRHNSKTVETKGYSYMKGKGAKGKGKGYRNGMMMLSPSPVPVPTTQTSAPTESSASPTTHAPIQSSAALSTLSPTRASTPSPPPTTTPSPTAAIPIFSWELIPPTILGFAVGDQAGRSVAVSSDGTVMAVGFPGSDVDGRRLTVDDSAADDTNGPGLVRVFALGADDESWEQLGGDIGFVRGGTPALFGYSIDLDESGLLLAIGAPGFDNNRGVVVALFYDFDENQWKTYGEAMLGNGVQGERFGTSVSISADGYVIAAGGPGVGTGAAKVFYLDETSDSWEQFGQDLVGEDTGDQCGCDVSLSYDGFIIAVGCPGSDRAFDNAGTVFLYQTDTEDFGSDWFLHGSPIDGKLAGEECGFSLELSNDGVVYGCPSRNASPPAGVIRVAAYTDNWQQVGQDINGASSDVSLGSSVTISRNSEIIAYFADPTRTTTGGHVIAVTYDGDEWRQVQRIELGVDPVVPISLDLDFIGTTLTIGYIGANDPGNAEGFLLTIASPISPPTSIPISRSASGLNTGIRPTSRSNTGSPTAIPTMTSNPTMSPAPSITAIPTITANPTTLLMNFIASTKDITPSSRPSRGTSDSPTLASIGKSSPPTTKSSATSPSLEPSIRASPTAGPTRAPTASPSSGPSKSPTSSPTSQSALTSIKPSVVPSSEPSESGDLPSQSPSIFPRPSQGPSDRPSSSPTTKSSSVSPGLKPSISPSVLTSILPSVVPIQSGSMASQSRSVFPTMTTPSSTPSFALSEFPSVVSKLPSSKPSTSSTAPPVTTPSSVPPTKSSSESPDSESSISSP